MKHFLPSLIRKAAAALLLTAAGAFPMLADGTIPYRANFDNAQMRYSSKGEYSKIKSTDIATYGEIGAPALPVRTYRFVVPVYTGKFTVSMTLPEKASETVTLDTPVMPVQRPVKAGDLQEARLTIDTKAYNKVYSPKAWVVDDYFIDGSNHIVTVAVMPVEYNPVASTMKYYPYVDIRLNYADVEVTEMSSCPVFTKRPDPNLDLSKIAVNGESPKRSVYPPFEGGGNGIAGTYIIISPIEYISAFKELAEWKRNKGYKVKLDTLDKIIARYPNGDAVSAINDDAGKLRAYLIDCFREHGRSYVLLAGDYHTEVPIRYAQTLMPDEGDEDQFSPTDVYYSDMSKNWDRNKDGKYGVRMFDGVSFYPDMFVGRLLCKNAQEVENYTRKLMLYERNPGAGNYSYLSHGLVSYSNQDPFVIKNQAEDDYNNILRDYFDSKFTSVTEMISISGNTIFTGADVISSINRGQGFCLIAGHGNPYRIVVSENDDKTEQELWANSEYNNNTLLTYNTNGFNNLMDISKPSILFADACSTTPFDTFTSKDLNYSKEYNLGGAYTVSGLYGGAAYIGYTRTSYKYPALYTAQNFLKLIDNGLSIGEVSSLARYNQTLYPINISDNSQDYISGLRYALIGDPEMNIWTNTPKRFNIGEPLINDGTATFTGSEISNAYVIVSDGKEIINRKKCMTETSISMTDINNCCVTFSKPGNLPQSFLFLDKGIINDERKYFMTSGTIKGFWIAPNAKVTIYASGNVTLDGGFTICGLGSLEIITDGSIWLNKGTPDTGGMLILKARGEIYTSSGFKSKGGFLRKSYIR